MIVSFSAFSEVFRQFLSKILACETLQANIVREPIIKINIYIAKLMLTFIIKFLIVDNTFEFLYFLSSIKVIIIKVYKNYTNNDCHFIIYINN